jgi:hypothetical protein
MTDDSSTDLNIGDRVTDRDANPDDRNTAVVVRERDEPAYAVRIDVLDASVADVNPEHPASGPVVDVAFAGDLDDALDVWHSADAEALAEICADHDVTTYSYPADRLSGVDE